MSEQILKQKADSSGRLAVVGDRELVIGYRLIGIDDTFIVSEILIWLQFLQRP